MKKVLLLMLFYGIAFAGKPTPRVDTLGVVDGVQKFMATWIISVTTTADTLISPFPGSIVETVHNGASTGDTVQVAYNQFGTAGFTEILTENRDIAFRDFSQSGKYSPAVRRVIIKGSGTIAVWVRIYN